MQVAHVDEGLVPTLRDCDLYTSVRATNLVDLAVDALVARPTTKLTRRFPICLLARLVSGSVLHETRQIDGHRGALAWFALNERLPPGLLRKALHY